MANICKKCGYERLASDTAPDYECPKCGVVYAKIEARRKVQDDDVQPPPADMRSPNSGFETGFQLGTFVRANWSLLTRIGIVASVIWPIVILMTNQPWVTTGPDAEWARMMRSWKHDWIAVFWIGFFPILIFWGAWFILRDSKKKIKE